MLPRFKWPVWKSCEIKGGSQEWLWWYRLMTKVLIATIQVILCWFLGWGNALLKFSPPTYTIPAISWPPPFFFHTGHFEQGRTVFSTAELFLRITVIICHLVTTTMHTVVCVAFIYSNSIISSLHIKKVFVFVSHFVCHVDNSPGATDRVQTEHCVNWWW